ncbi:conserved exported hypothetical protein [Candidatus Sulfopaludibacter sp. SbA3]|nr:conserved exported hypothetical protein [Candidatus Sulfopaludibacter sp. SbA3]
MKIISCAVLAALALVPVGCKQAKKVQVQQTVEEAPRLASTVPMGDPKLETQLASGFYGIEGNAWRWAARQFTVVLRPPFGASQRGGALQLNLTVPQVIIDKLKNISLTAAIDGSPLAPETYTQAGPYTYKRDLPANLLTADSVKVEFQLDKAMPPTDQDKRELGVVVNSVSLVAK